MEAAEKRGKLPYFIRDNRDDVEGILNPKINERTLPDKLILIAGKGDPLFDYMEDYFLPQSVRDDLEEIKEIKTFNQIREYFSQFGIEVTSDVQDLYDMADEHIENIALMGQKLIVAHRSYTDLLGKDVLKSLKRINFLDQGEDMGSAQAAYFYNAIGEKDPWAGTLRISSPFLNGHSMFHELAHAIQDSVKYANEDAVLAAQRIVRRCKLDESVGAYFGASASDMDAERMADAFANLFTRKKHKLEADFFERFMNEHMNETNDKPHYGSAMKLGRSATKEAMKVVENIGAPELSEIQKKNIRELADALGIPRKEVKPMSFLDADQGASNPKKYRDNCQSVVVAFEARRRGLDCYALSYSSNPESISYALGERFQDAWINPKSGKTIEPTIFRGKTDEEIISKLRKGCNSDGRYILGVNYKDGRGHVISIDRIEGKFLLTDEQENDFYNLDGL